jgi:uncharacterized repeat protein (TIGR01451 family)
MFVLACLALALIHSPAADTAPGDVADLSVTKSDSPDPVAVDGTLTYTIEVRNLGPEGATGVFVNDRFPNRTELLSATTSKGNCQRRGRRVICNVGSMAADLTGANPVTVTIQVRPLKVGEIRNSVSVENVETDPVLVNDAAETTTQVVAPPPTSTCRGRPTTLAGTRGNDLLVGTGGPDVIAGLGGRDVIVGRSGRDLICAGGGPDRVYAGTAADRVFGGRGADRLLGRGGPDLLAGNPGRDVLRGNRGADRLRGGGGFDRCSGGAGLDRERSCER